MYHHRRPCLWLHVLILLAACPLAVLHADGSADNVGESVRRVPPAGVEVPAAEQASLRARIDSLREGIASVDPKAPQAALLPDVEVLAKAVDDSLRYQEFQKLDEIRTASALLDLATERLQQLKNGEAPWTKQEGLVVRGYRSRLDGSVQPCGIEIPERYDFTGTSKHRLDLWFHGRGETLTEVNFLQQRLKTPGPIHPAGAVVLHPYARYSNGNKLGGEIDCLEALEFVKANYAIDETRIVVRGFSMGGAATWNLAAHYADRWMAATPGAGFSETPEFLTVYQLERLQPAWYERKLWHLYDITDCALNFSGLPLIGYSGEIDRQQQAADAMRRALTREGLPFEEIIGKDMGHKIDPASMDLIEKRLSEIEAATRPAVPSTVRFVTWTLRYPKMHWVTLQGLDHHWEEARFEGTVNADGVTIQKVQNVRSLTLHFEKATAPFTAPGPVKIRIDGEEITGPSLMADGGWQAHLRRTMSGHWEPSASPWPEAISKRPGLQGPIDDAFLNPFLFVMPTGHPQSESGGDFVDRELQRAIVHWRQHFRGEVRIKKDVEVTAEDIHSYNLIVWGDPSSNSILAKVLPKLPVVWTPESVGVGERIFDSKHHALILIQPNPLNPGRYVVVNSGFTWREYDYLNNARQVPKLPDWAVVDTSTTMTSRGPGAIAAADFFDEAWQPKATDVVAEQAKVDAEVKTLRADALRYWIDKWGASEKTKDLATPLKEMLKGLSN